MTFGRQVEEPLRKISGGRAFEILPVAHLAVILQNGRRRYKNCLRINFKIFVISNIDI